MINWNKTGKIKAILLAVFSIPNLIMPIGANPQEELLFSILMPLIYGCVAIPLISKFNSSLLGREIVKPHWNDNPLTLKRPLVFFHYGAFFFLISGLSMVIGTAIKFQLISSFGLRSISFGIGILLGIKITLKWFNKNQ